MTTEDADQLKSSDRASLSEYVQASPPSCYGNYALNILTQIRMASPLWDIGKQCRPRSDAA